MSDWEKIRDTARQLRQKASILEEIADGLERRAEEEGRNHNSFDDDAFINQVRMIYGGFVPGVFKICELTGCSKEQAKRIRGKLIEFFGEGKAETPEALEEERRLLVEDPPYVPFEEKYPPPISPAFAQELSNVFASFARSTSAQVPTEPGF